MYHLRWHCLIVGLSRNLWNVLQREEVEQALSIGWLGGQLLQCQRVWEYTSDPWRQEKRCLGRC